MHLMPGYVIWVSHREALPTIASLSAMMSLLPSRGCSVNIMSAVMDHFEASAPAVSEKNFGKVTPRVCCCSRVDACMVLASASRFWFCICKIMRHWSSENAGGGADPTSDVGASLLFSMALTNSAASFGAQASRSKIELPAFSFLCPVPNHTRRQRCSAVVALKRNFLKRQNSNNQSEHN